MDICICGPEYFKIIFSLFVFKMKDSKISLLLLVSLSLLLLAFVVLFIWGFTYYKQSIAASQPTTFVIKDSSAIAGNIRDSLQKMYTATINKIYDGLDSTAKNSDAIQEGMDEKLREFVSLKNEIAGILEKSSSPQEVLQARNKLTDLQKKLDEWRSRYNDVSEENKRLSFLLARLSQNTGSNIAAGNTLPVSTNRASNIPARNVSNGLLSASEPTVTPDATEARSALLFTTTNMQLKAVMINNNDDDRETQQASQAGELRGSFTLKNTQQSVKSAEVYIIVLQPDGKVMKQSSWESGLFETPQGRKIYSSKIRFDYSRSENKAINFSINAEGYQKGVYTLQVYYNGSLVGRTSKRLS